MDNSMNNLLQDMLLGIIPSELYGEDDFPPLRFSGLETTEEDESDSHESESQKRKRDYEDIKRRFYHESNRTE